MLIQLIVGLMMTALTVGCGATAIVFSGERLRRMERQAARERRMVKDVSVLAFAATALVAAMLVMVLIWALLLMAVGVFSDLETALYFAMVSFTTLGFGDVILPEDWRLLAGFIAVDGFLVFGLNTAFLFEILRRLRDR